MKQRIEYAIELICSMSDEQIERALEVFEQEYKEYKNTQRESA